MSLAEPPNELNLTETKVPSLVSGLVITWVLGAATVALRVTARKLVGNQIWWDDWMIIVSLIFSAAFLFDVTCYMTINGGFGKHVWATPDGLRVYFTGLFIAEHLYTISIVLVKAAILAFYWRIFSARRESRLAIYILLGITCAWGIALLVSTFQCLPVSAFWLRFDANANLSPSDYECGVNVKTFFIANAIPNIITDVLLLLLPVPGIWSLQLRKPQKMALVGIFTLGIFVTAVSFIRLHYVLAIDFADPDTTWLLTEEMMWTGIEVNIGTVSGMSSARHSCPRFEESSGYLLIPLACLPSLKPILNLALHGNAQRSKPATGSDLGIMTAGGSSGPYKRGGDQRKSAFGTRTSERQVTEDMHPLSSVTTDHEMDTWTEHGSQDLVIEQTTKGRVESGKPAPSS
ncbi:integral membrane protein [Colletotrichum kahawae]|uniref:Integral membrane protein n=1 Tax=Colletotrichum kahawae TaxID=34407 RepID=A0AAD9Y477_COLKA|nr:integral membrane protein [Colletotrichum kahawae]